MSKLYLVRHAEPELTGVLLGACDPPLSPAGRRDATAIRLRDVAVIYTSALRRARDTATAIGQAPIRVDPDLNEISYGEWDGLTWHEIADKYPEEAKAKLACWPAVTPPGGERWEHFEQRVTRALARIRHGMFPAAVVAHITVNAAITHVITGRNPSEYTQSYCEVLTYDL
jgi:broad specificity phosphatase PhoE